LDNGAKLTDNEPKQVPIEKLTKAQLIELIYGMQETMQRSNGPREGQIHFVEIELPGIGNVKMQSPADSTDNQLCFVNALSFLNQVKWKDWGTRVDYAQRTGSQMI
jgi:hypothetical protein